jgi:hypothetical protein
VIAFSLGIQMDEFLSWGFVHLTFDWPHIISDATFLPWQKAARNDKEASKIKYIFRFHIVNDLTIAINDTALKRKGKSIEKWFSTTFDMSTELVALAYFCVC